MGRLPKPTAVLDASGAFINHPDRKRPNEPQADRPLGSPPKYLSPEEKKIWKEISAKLLPGVAFESDREAFEMLVRLTHKMRTNFAAMMASDRAQLINLYARFAMTPADRSKVQVAAPKEGQLDKFLRGGSKRVNTTPPEVPADQQLAN
jgi:phage terminase small subunit